jgi:anti-anti-sigma regulatory factor
MSTKDQYDFAPDGASEGSADAARTTTIIVTTKDDCAVVHVEGRLDGAGGALLREAAGTLARARLARVALNLSAVTHADLHGVRAVAAFRDAIETAGAALAIRHADLTTYPIDWHVIPLGEDGA